MVLVFALGLIVPLAIYAGVLWAIQRAFSSYPKDLVAGAVAVLSIVQLAGVANQPGEMGNGAVYEYLATLLVTLFGIFSVVVLIASLHRRKI